MQRPRSKQHYGCPSMGVECADYNDTGEPCRYCHAETIPVYPCVESGCERWSRLENGSCVECVARLDGVQLQQPAPPAPHVVAVYEAAMRLRLARWKARRAQSELEQAETEFINTCELAELTACAAARRAEEGEHGNRGA